MNQPNQLVTIKHYPLKNKTVLVRADFNVPLTPHQPPKVLDDTRIRLTIPTIEYLIKKNCKIILCSHLGRPDGKTNKHLSLKPIRDCLQKLLNKKVNFSTLNPNQLHTSLSKLQNQDILMLENLRFNKSEEKNSKHFSRLLASLAQVYINDAFSASHRNHASLTGIPKLLPSVAGLHFSDELNLLTMIMGKPKRPLVTVVGGAKMSTKAAAVSKLATISDVVLVGGGVANSFIKAEGYDIAGTPIESSYMRQGSKKVKPVTLAGNIITSTRTQKLLLHGYIPISKVLYPIDVIAADSLQHPKTLTNISLTEDNNHLKKTLKYLDIGPKTQRLFREIILQAQTVFWNGPMGVYENKNFKTGTDKIARAVAKTSATTIVGGGDTLAAIAHFNLQNRFDYVSTSGGAALDYLGNQSLPALKPLLKS